MGFELNTENYIEYLIMTNKVLDTQKDFVTMLDAETGDGDHWVNLHMGYEKIVSSVDEMRGLSLSKLLSKVGMIMFSTIGGSSGALYGSGYMAASKSLQDKQTLTVESLYIMLDNMLKAIMERGKTSPGQKTMVDSLYLALEYYQKSKDQIDNEVEIIQSFINGAKDGAESTRNMEAARGRASYRTDKGVGHLDPGAITMSIQLECLGNYILEQLGGN